MKKITLLIVAFCMALPLMAVPARPGRIPYTQPDGSVIVIEMHGDEFFHWVTGEDGGLLEMDAEGFYRPMTTAPETLEAARSEGNARRQKAHEQRTARASAVTGRRHYLVVLVEFKNLFFRSSTAQADFTRLLNEEGYSSNGGHGSARDFYYDNSGGRFEPVFDVVGPVRVSKDYSYYGSGSNGYDAHPDELLYEACKDLDTSVDFSQYDNDGDGFVDLVFYYFAGTNEAEGGGSDRIWPHQSALYYYYNSAVFDGVHVYEYACSSELNAYGQMCGIGTACHEFGHAMGLPDMYDTDYETNGSAGALYSYSLMCSGSYNDMGRRPPYFNMQERMFLGWNTESDIREVTSGSLTIPALTGSTQQVYKVSTENEGEYFMLEARAQSGWDAALPGRGLLVYHIDKSSNRVGYSTAARLWNWESSGNKINANGSHPCCYLIPAANTTSLNYSGGEGAIPFPYRTSRVHVNSYTPVAWSGDEVSCSLEDIAISGSSVTMNVFLPPNDISVMGYNFIDNPGNGTYSNNSRFNFKLVTAESNPPSSVEWYYDDARKTSSYVTVRTGDHTVRAELTYADGSTETLILEITVN